MECPACRFENRTGRRFCSQCGAALPVACPGCGFSNEGGEKFCGGCGAALSSPPVAPPVAQPAPAPERAPAGERRQVTIVFTDLSGFTRLSSNMDPEETHALLNRFFEVTDAIVEKYGGSVDKHIGDNVMAVFGAPIAHGNDPERAIRAALDIHQAMPGLSEDLGRPIAVHIGIASGEVVASGTGGATRQDYTVTGGSVNLASRLDDMAGPGETFISDAVHRAVSHWLDCRAMDDVTVAGLDKPVRIWRVDAVRDTGSPGEARSFVGRRAELRQFAGVIESCQETGAGQTVYVRGEAGIGKTRLVEEFRRIADTARFVCHTGLVLDFGVGTGQDAISAIVRGILAIAPGDDEAARAAAARRGVADGLVSPDHEVYLNDLLDLAQPAEIAAIHDAMDNATRNRGKQRTVSDLLIKAAARRPLLVVVEDVHWADPVVLAYLAALSGAVAKCPAVMIMTSRIEGDRIDQAWRAATRANPLMTFDLAPLREDEALDLASEYFDASDRFARTCIERADGNPLFLEQLLRGAEDAMDDRLPGSIQSLVLARMDNLDAPDRAALQAASAAGQRFSLDLLRHMTDSPNYTCAGLVEHVLVRPEGEDFMFAHALVRDGVYSSLLKDRRWELHRRAANWFADRDPVLHAEHLDRAEDVSAPRAYLAASEAQAGQYRHDRARQLVDRGLEIASDRADFYALICLQGRILHDLGLAAESIVAYQRALDFADDDAAKCRAWIGLASGMRIVDRFDEALEALDKAEQAASRHDLTSELAQLHYLRGNLYFPLGNLDGCLEQHQLALGFARQVGSTESEALALSGLGDAYYSRGRMKTAFEHFQRCVELCRRHGHGGIAVSNHYMVAWTQLYLCEVEPALEGALAACEAASLVANRRAEMVARLTAARVLYERRELAEARKHLDTGLLLADELGAARFEAFFLIYLSRIARADDGDNARALAMINKAVDVSRKTGITFLGPWVLSTLALLDDDPATRAQALDEGEKILREGCVGHNYFSFYRDAMEVALAERDWDGLSRYAQALEDYGRPEPLPMSDFFVARGRALARHGSGQRDAATMTELGRLRDEAARIGFRNALPALEKALAAA